MDQVERRKHVRINSHIPLTILYNDRSIAHLYTLNASIGGLLIDAQDLGLPINSLIKIVFRHKNAITHPAIVTRIQDNSLGVTFESLAAAAESEISSVLLCHTAPSAVY